MRHRAARGRRPAAPWLVALVLLVLTACTGGPVEQQDRLDGTRLVVLATWSGAERERFSEVLRSFELRTGAVVSYESAQHRLPDVLADRLAEGRPPDVAFLPQPGLLRELARQGRLVPLDRETEIEVRARFPAAFHALGSAQGRLFGVWFKAADKSLVWYDVAAFERVGAVPPGDLPGLLSLAQRLSAGGTPAFAVSGLDGWTLTDWFENLLLRLAGPQAYDDLVERRLPWTAPEVRQSLEAMLRLLAPQHLVGGTAGAVATDFESSVAQVFAGPAAMVVEGDFVAGVVESRTRAQLGVDADVFPFPAGPQGSSMVVGGGDVAVLLRESRAGAALLRYLTTPEAASSWAAAGGFLSPNLDLDLAVYPDDVTRGIARRLLEAGDGFRFDLSDLVPAAFGGREDAGLRAELRELLVHRDPDRTATRLEAAAQAAEEPS